MNPNERATQHPDVDSDRTLSKAALAAVGDETRLRILEALYLARDTDRHPDVRPTPFSELRKRVGMADGSQFNYHLKQLVGPFVTQTEDGYVLRRAGERIVTAVLAGEYADAVVYDAEPIPTPCAICGGDVVLDYNVEPYLDYLVVRCTNCEGVMSGTGRPPGMLSLTDAMPPIGMQTRDPIETYLATFSFVGNQFRTIVDGVCPHCAGRMTAEPQVCDDHDPGDGTVCESCQTIFFVWYRHRCAVCGFSPRIFLDRHFVVHPTVTAFYHDHGYDPFGPEWLRVATETIAAQTVVTEDPFELEVQLEIDDDALTVTLDGNGDVLSVT
ncbi:winged helix-turn-helix domain-containing protein [Halorubellus litoreus]|uniref:Winged helix-turn-helix domain-containing protein n=1 Tax=Halorubellus litoreus TaxID=755308 RepID=A0ABD5VFX9_9EURY